MSDREIGETLEQLFRMAQRQFGTAVKGHWLHDGDGCPGCGREIDALKYKGKDSLSLNAFIFREHGVLIAYLLCSKCVKYIMKKSKKDPVGTTPLHLKIEKNLKEAFIKHLGH
jgi:hypothetical protein